MRPIVLAIVFTLTVSCTLASAENSIEFFAAEIDSILELTQNPDFKRDLLPEELETDQLLKKVENGEDSIKVLETQLEKYPNSLEIFRLYKEVIFHHGKRQQILPIYKQRLDNNPEDVTSLYMYAELLYNVKIADSLANRAIELDPDFHWAYALLAHNAYRLQLDAQDDKERDKIRKNMLSNIHKALSINPKAEQTYFPLGIYYYYITDEDEKAIASFAFAHNTTPFLWIKMVRNCGIIYPRLGQTENTINFYENLIPYLKKDRLVDAYYNLAKSYISLGQKEKSLEYLIKCEDNLSIDQISIEAFVDIANRKQFKALKNRAQKKQEKTINENEIELKNKAKNHKNAHIFKEKIINHNFDANNFKSCLRNIKEYEELYGLPSRLHILAARCYVKTGNNPKAIKQLKNLIDSGFNHSEILIKYFPSLENNPAFRDLIVKMDSSNQKFQDRWFQDRFLESEGMSHKNAWSAYQDKDGFIWLGTEVGINRYNGIEMKSYTPRDGMDYSYTVGMYDSPDGGILGITIQDGLIQIKDDLITRYSLADGMLSYGANNNAAMELVEYEGYVWFSVATENNKRGLCGFNGKEFKNISDGDGFPGTRAYDFALYDGKLLFSTSSGVYQYQNNKIERFLSVEDGLPTNNIRALHVSADSALWLGSREGAIRYKDGDITLLNENDGLYQNYTFDIDSDSKGNIFLLNYHGIDVYQNGKVYNYQILDPENTAIMTLDIAVDSFDNIWVSYFLGGVVKITAKEFFSNATHKDIPVDLVYKDDDDNVYLRSKDHKIYDYETNLLCDFSDHPELSPRHIFYKDSKGNFWFGDQHGKNDPLDVIRYKDGEFTRYAISDYIGRHRGCWNIFEDSTGVVWFSAWGGGVLKYKDEKFEVFDVGDGNFKTSYKDREGNIWLVFEDHYIRKVQDSTLVEYSFAEVYDGKLAWRMCQLSDGTYLIDTWGGPFLLFDGENFEKFILPDYINESSIELCSEDVEGNLWFPGGNLMYKYDWETKEYIAYNNSMKYKGLSTGEIIATPDSIVWINTFGQSALALPEVWKFDMREMDRFLPVCHIENITLNDSIKIYSEQERFAYNQNNLKFSYCGINYRNPGSIRYKYRLKGFQDNWSIITRRPDVTYTNLDPGKYSFEVKASNQHGLWNENPAIYSFVIKPPFWETTWAYLTYFVLLVTGITLFIRWRTKAQRLKLQRKEQELASEREVSEALKRADKLKDEFLANTSHELRTPLNGIIGLAESLIDGAAGDLNETLKRNLSLIFSSGKRLATLVDDILDFSKLRTHELKLNLRPLDIKPLAEIVIELTGTLVSGKKLNIINNIPADIPAVLGDENRVQQVLFNLVGNAFKFTEEGEIELNAEENEKKVIISIRDTGIGIDPAFQDKIFSSFEQEDASTTRKYGGTGLGLAVTKQLVELHDGQIWFESEPGQGSTFYFSLPVSAQPSEKVITESGSKMPILKLVEEEQANGQKILSYDNLEILVVDDESINQEVLKNHLVTNNYNITQAFNGEEALELLANSHNFDLVLLDIMMPKISGYEVCRRIRQKLSASELPIIMLTAKNQVNDLVEGLSAGANDYIAKPFSKNELLARIKTHLDLLKIHSAAARFVPWEFIRTLDKESIIEVGLNDHVEDEMTVMFCDIRSFTTISESMTPHENFQFLNEYLNMMTPVIRKYNGFIDKFIGDAIMALFPTSSADAMRAAIEMQDVVAKLNKTRAQRGEIPVRIGTGLHRGNLMLGTVGDSLRMEGTVISDVVNIASRLEGLTKWSGTSTVISDEVVSGLNGDKKEFNLRPLGNVRVKGKKNSIAIFDLIDSETGEISKRRISLKDKFEEALELYYKREFKQSLDIFAEVLENDPEDLATKYYRNECLEYLGTPPESSWDGVVNMINK